MRLISLFCALLFGPASIAAQQLSQSCPVITVEAKDKVDSRTPVVFTARFQTSVPQEHLKYRWWVSAGTIVGGPKTSSITLDVVGLGGQVVTTTVVVTINDDVCSASKTINILPLSPACGLPFDHYGDIRFSYEKWRLDNFAIHLLNEPDSRGVIVTFAGKQTYKGEAADRLQRARNYLVKVRKIPTERVFTIDGGYLNDLTTYLVIVPPNEKIPTAAAWGFQIPREAVRFTKRKASAPTTTRKRSN